MSETTNIANIVPEPQEAGEQLTRIADGKEVVSVPPDPLTPVDVQRGGQTQLVTKTRRTATRGQTRDL